LAANLVLRGRPPGFDEQLRTALKGNTTLLGTFVDPAIRGTAQNTRVYKFGFGRQPLTEGAHLEFSLWNIFGYDGELFQEPDEHGSRYVLKGGFYRPGFMGIVSPSTDLSAILNFCLERGDQTAVSLDVGRQAADYLQAVRPDMAGELQDLYLK